MALRTEIKGGIEFGLLPADPGYGVGQVLERVLVAASQEGGFADITGNSFAVGRIVIGLGIGDGAEIPGPGQNAEAWRQAGHFDAWIPLRSRMRITGMGGSAIS